MSDLSAQRQSEIARMQAVLKPEYRSELLYTTAENGIFVVMLPVRYGGQLHEIVLSGCHTPSNPSLKCRHDCGVGFERQYWEATPLTEFGRCEDDAPIWLHPNAPLAPFDVPSNA